MDKKSSGDLYQTVLLSSNFSLPKNHILNTHYTAESKEKLYMDILSYSIFVHGLDAQKKNITIENPLQIVANFYDILIYLEENSSFQIIVPFAAKEKDFRNHIKIKKIKDKYFPII